MKTMAVGLMAVLAAAAALGNGGPFVIKYPGGDPAAKGVFARIDPSLLPAEEARLEVVKEDLTINFLDRNGFRRTKAGAGDTPLVGVTAAYRIRNPMDEEITVDFGFPIVRGIFVSPFAMMPQPQVYVQVDGKPTSATIISSSGIYGLIRRSAREVVTKGVEADPELRTLVAAVAEGKGGDKARRALAEYLAGKPGWNVRDAALMVEYAAIDFGKPAEGRGFLRGAGDPDLYAAAAQNLAFLHAIGEQKATQLFAQLASKFDAGKAASYEAIFAAWGGDPREMALDMATGTLRPREITLEKATNNALRAFSQSSLDPAIYARVDYLDTNAKLTDEQKTACKNILKNLPVVFTFAPMNLLYYRVSFKPQSEQTVVVSYSQYAFLDTRDPESCQLAYVVRPASLWKRFGPITLEVKAPRGVKVVASVPCEGKDTEEMPLGNRTIVAQKHVGTVTDKKADLYVAIDRRGWLAAITEPNAPNPAPSGK